MPTLGGSVGEGVGEGDGEGTGEGTKVVVVVGRISSTLVTTSTPMTALICVVNASLVGSGTFVPPGFALTAVVTLTICFGDACTAIGMILPNLAKVCCNAVAFAAELAISSTFEASPVLMVALT